MTKNENNARRENLNKLNRWLAGERDAVGFAPVGAGDKFPQVLNVGLRALKIASRVFVAATGLATLAAAVGYYFPGGQKFISELFGVQTGPIAPIFGLWFADLAFGMSVLHQPSFLLAHVQAWMLGQWAAHNAFCESFAICSTAGEAQAVIAAVYLRERGLTQKDVARIVAWIALDNSGRYLTPAHNTVLVLRRCGCRISKVPSIIAANEYLRALHARIRKLFTREQL